MSIPSVEVLELRPIDEPRGNLLAFAKVRLSGKLTLADFRLIQQTGQRPFVAAPSKSWESPTGRKYSPLVEMPREWADAIQEAVLSEWELHRGVRQLGRVS